ncbi:MAG: hypothetical protein OXG40_11845 [Acidimicrobiaceae bacterium]|nr:hypothetical protein [Acidimicrobiaceae bacterium]
MDERIDRGHPDGYTRIDIGDPDDYVNEWHYDGLYWQVLLPGTHAQCWLARLNGGAVAHVAPPVPGLPDKGWGRVVAVTMLYRTELPSGLPHEQRLDLVSREWFSMVVTARQRGSGDAVLESYRSLPYEGDLKYLDAMLADGQLRPLPMAGEGWQSQLEGLLLPRPTPTPQELRETVGKMVSRNRRWRRENRATARHYRSLAKRLRQEGMLP